MTQIEFDTCHYIQMIPKCLDEVKKQLSRIANVLEKMEAKDGPTIGQIVRDAIERGEQEKINKEKNNEPVLQ
jgi:hypothetical protein